MAQFTKVNSFTEKLAEKAFNLGSDVIVVALTNTPHTASWSQLSDLTQISYTNLSSRTVTVTSSSQTDGVYKLVLADLTLTCSGTVGPFRYIYLYDDTATNDELIGYYDYGQSITLTEGNVFIIDFSDSQGALTIT